MKVPPYNVILPFAAISAISISFLVFLILSVIVPGFFIWLGLKLIGKERGIVRCGLANLAAVLFATILAALIGLIPVINLITPLAFFLTYLYGLKSLLDVGILEAFVATVLATVIIVAIAFVMAVITGLWFVSFAPPARFPF
jgi:hypothetical protein